MGVSADFYFRDSNGTPKFTFGAGRLYYYQNNKQQFPKWRMSRDEALVYLLENTGRQLDEVYENSYRTLKQTAWVLSDSLYLVSQMPSDWTVEIEAEGGTTEDEFGAVDLYSTASEAIKMHWRDKK